MKKFLNLLLGLFLISGTVYSQTANGRIRVLKDNDTTYSIVVQIAVQNGSFDLGNSVIRLNYNPNAVIFPQNPVKNRDYIFQNFDNNSIGYYAAVSRSSAGTMSINIANLENKGTSVGTDYIDVVTINFAISGSNNSPGITLGLLQFFSPAGTTQWTNGDWNVDNTLSGIAQSGTQPKTFELMQNYPNPFNPTTKIKFRLPATSRVELKVYNILGEKVSTLVNETKAAGTYEVPFDASGLASGVYIYRIEAGPFVETKKMILLR